MAQTVIQHVLSRLHDLGVKDVFGVPGDYAFPVNDAVCSDSRLRWVGSCNELNAAYAADGYARIAAWPHSAPPTAWASSARSTASPALMPSTYRYSIWSACRPAQCRGRIPRSPHAGQRRVRSVPQDNRAGGLCTSDHDPGQLHR